MDKKIIILNGSPRPNGNTAALIEAFKKGAADENAESSQIYILMRHSPANTSLFSYP